MSGYDTNDHKSRDEKLQTLLEEGRSGYNKPTETNQVRMAVVEVDGKLYDSDNSIKTEDSIRRILAEVDLEDNMKRLHEQINIELNPKP